jgi:hypothetical protein
MKSKLRPEYKQEMMDLEQKMLDAQEFAEQFPVFADRILQYKFSKDFTGEIHNLYKGLRFGWGIKRWFYREKQNITNYRGDFSPQYLWVIYINQVDIFGDDYKDTDIGEISRIIDVFFFDHLNTTFYATDNQIMPLLDALADWYAESKVINDEYRKEKKKLELLAQLERLK